MQRCLLRIEPLLRISFASFFKIRSAKIASRQSLSNYFTKCISCMTKIILFSRHI